MGFTGKKQTTVTQAQFYQLCEAIKSHKELLELKGIQTVIAKLEEILGFALSVSSVQTAVKLTGVPVQLTVKHKASKDRIHNFVRSLVLSHVALLRKMGEPVPEGVQNAWNFYQGQADDNGQPAACQKAVLGIPVKEVPRPQTIPVVNNRR